MRVVVFFSARVCVVMNSPTIVRLLGLLICALIKYGK